MKKTYFKVIIREIKDSFGRFAAIFGIVALGVGFLSGLLVTTPDMHLSVDEYYDDNNMADIFIKATMGLTQKDIDEVSSMDEINELMPAYVTDTLMETSNSEVLATKVYGLPLINNDQKPPNINRLKLLEGKWPENENECLVERGGSFLKDIEIGSKLIVSKENEDYKDIGDIYKAKEYKVVGIVGNSFHFSMEREVSNVGNGRLGAIIYVDKSSYALDVYTDFYITSTGAIEMDAFSDEYEIKMEKIVDKLEGIGKKRSVIRYNEILTEAYEELDEGKVEYEEAKLEAETELNDALIEIEDGKIELADGLKELQNGKKELADAKITLKVETLDAQTKINDAKVELADALIELEDGEKELADALIELKDGQKKYFEGYIEYLNAKTELEDGQLEFDDGEQKYLDGVEKIADAKKEIRKGERELASGKRQLESAEKELDAGIRELEGQKAQFEQLMDPILVGLNYSSSTQLFNAIENDSTGAIKGALTGVLSGMVNQLQGGISQLEGQIIQIKAGISGLEEQIAGIESGAILDDEGNLSALKAQLNELKSNLSKINSELSNLKSNLDSLPKDASVLQGGWNAIKDGETQLSYGADEIADGWSKYYEGREKIQDANEEIEKGEDELEDAKIELEENRQKLADGWVELEEGRIELEDAKVKLDDGYTKYDDGRIELDDGWVKYNDGLVELSDAEITLKEELAKANIEIKDAEKDLAQGQIDYNEGELELLDGEKKYYDAKVEAESKLADAALDITKAEKEISDIEKPEWYVLDRNSNMSFVSYVLNAEKLAAIAKVFPMFFYLVAALVALTTMTRMVEEERTQIGTLKALGYTKSLIMFKYIIYCGLASVMGSVAGLLVGFKLLPVIIYNAYGVLYHLPDFIAQFNTRIAIISSGLAILSTMAAAIYACNQALKEKPAILMLPRAPKAGKRIMLERISFIWTRMSFNHKATARNLFRYKKHFFMTVIGISGCTALLLTGFGLRDSIGVVAKYQFNEILKYDVLIELDDKNVIDDKLDKILKDTNKVESYMDVFIDKGYGELNGNRMATTIFIPEETNSLSEFIDLRDRKSGNEVVFKESSIVITEKMSTTLDLYSGDVFTLENSDGATAEFTVTDVTENYLGNYVYMNKADYNNAFNVDLDKNNIIVETSIEDLAQQDNLISELLSSESILNAEFITQTKKTFDNMLTSINYIVIVIIIASGALAFIVLYNLTNININERRKELATLKVLGFHNEEVSAYIFRETTILSLIGMGTGLLLGRLLHSFIITTVENPEFMFGRNIMPFSFVLSGTITIIFSLIVNLFMNKKLKNIKMVDSMKAID